MNGVLKSALLLAALWLSSGPLSASGGARLGDEIIPRHYDVELDLDPAADTFRGQMEIRLDVQRVARRIQLHAKDLRIDQAVLKDSAGHARIMQFRQLDQAGTAELFDDEEIAPGAYWLKLRYEADYSSSLNGLYRTVHNGRPYLFTHFQPVAARSVFPLFDEPAFKARWSLRFRVPQGFRVLANGRMAGVGDDADGRKDWRFASTAPLPSYALAFAVGEFDEVVGPDVPPSAARSTPLPLRAFAPKGEGGRLAHALSSTAPVVLQMERFFGTAFPYDKLDIVAVPEFMPAGMENAALVFYRSAMVLLGEDATEVQRRDFLVLHAHELAHQWFGNATSIRWWNDLWLNEGFATWLAHYVVEGPGFNSSSARIALHRQLRHDALSAALPLRLPVPDTDAIEAAFNRASYEKAAFLIDVLYRRHGEARLRAATARLLGASHGQYDAEDWLSALRESISPEAEQWFASYMTQPGLPLLIADDRCADAEGTFAVRQTRYLLDATATGKEFWPLEVCVLSDGQQVCRRFDPPHQQRLGFDACSAGGPLVDLSFDDYRVWALDQRQWERVLPMEATVESRNHLGHLSASLHTGTLSAEQFIRFLPRTVDGTHVVLAIDDLKLLLDQVLDHAGRERLIDMFDQSYGHVIAGLTERVTGGSVLPMSKEEQRLLYFLALDLRHPKLRPALLAKAKRLMGLDGPRESPSPAVSDFIGAALAVGVQQLGEPFFEQLLAELEQTTDGFARAMLIQGLAGADTDALAARVHALIPGTEVSLAEKPILIFNHLALTGNPQRMFDWLQSHWPAMQAALPPQYLARSVSMVDGLCESDSAESVRDFFMSRIGELPGGAHALDSATAKISECSRFRAHHSDAIGSTQ